MNFVELIHKIKNFIIHNSVTIREFLDGPIEKQKKLTTANTLEKERLEHGEEGTTSANSNQPSHVCEITAKDIPTSASSSSEHEHDDDASLVEQDLRLAKRLQMELNREEAACTRRDMYVLRSRNIKD